MFRLFIAVFSSALTVLVARTAHGGCIAPVLLQRQQALPLGLHLIVTHDQAVVVPGKKLDVLVMLQLC